MLRFCIILLTFPALIAAEAPMDITPVPAAEAAPLIGASSASAKVESFIDENKDDFVSGSYIDRMWLVRVKKDGDRVWVASVSEPRFGFRFLKVDPSGLVSELKGEELKRHTRWLR